MAIEKAKKTTTKATMQNDRKSTGNGANHNDRTSTKGAEHLQEEDLDGVQVWRFIEGEELPEGTFIGEGELEAFEREYYRTRYEAGCLAQAKKYEERREYKKAEECTTDRLYESEKTRPESTILQVGKEGAYTDEVALRKMFVAFKEAVEEEKTDDSLLGKKREPELDETGKPKKGRPKEIITGARIRVLDISMHWQETSKHAHARQVYEIRDEHGHWKPNQEACLAYLGYEVTSKRDIPKPPAKKKNETKAEKEAREKAEKLYKRYTNRKVTQTEKMMQKWYDIVEQVDKSLKVDRTPKAPKKAKKLDHDKRIDKEEKIALKALKQSERAQFDAMKAFIQEKGLQDEYEAFYEEMYAKQYEDVPAEAFDMSVDDIELD